MNVLTIIVNYRAAHLVIECLDSLQAQELDGGELRVAVVDNASGDGSAGRIEQAIQSRGLAAWVSMIPLQENRGFAAGNNAAIRRALNSVDPPEYFFLLNPDTMARPGAVAALVKFMDAHPQAGIAGSRLEWPDGRPQQAAFRFHGIAVELDRGLRLGVVTRLLAPWIAAPHATENPRQVDWVSGAAMMVRREALQSAGLMDEGYFMYYEEADFCLAARRAGWERWQVPQSRVVHLVGDGSIGTGDGAPAKPRPDYWFESRRRYFVKNHGVLYAACADAAWISGYALWCVRRILQRRPRIDPKGALARFIRHSVFVQGARPPSASG